MACRVSHNFGSPDKSVGLGIKFSESEKKEPNIRHSS